MKKIWEEIIPCSLMISFIGLVAISTIYKPNPTINPTLIYRDVDGDSIEDKIMQGNQQEVLFGVDVNGKRLYLPKDYIGEYEAR